MLLSLPNPATLSTFAAKAIRFWIPVLLIGLCAGMAASGNKLMLGPVVLPFAIIGGLLILAKRTWIFWILVISCMFNDHLGVPLGGLNLRPYVVLAAVGLGALILLGPAQLVTPQLQRARRRTFLFLPLVLLIAAKFVSWLLVTDFPLGMPRVFPLKHLLFASLLFSSAIVTALYLPNRKALDQAVRLWIVLSSIACIIGIIQIVASNALGMHWVHQREVIFYGRPFAWFREPDVFGSMAGATTVLVAPLVLLKSRLLPLSHLKFHLGVNGLLLLLLFVRAAWLGSIVAAGFIFLGLLRLHKTETILPWIKAGMTGFILLFLLLPILAPSFVADVNSRVGSLAAPSEEGASKYRIQDLNAMWAQVTPAAPLNESATKILFGHGDMSWSYWAPHLISHAYDTNALHELRTHGIVMVHPGFCMALSIAFDNGLTGLVLALLFFIGLLTAVLRRVHRTANHEDAALLLALAAPILLLLICFQFSYDPITPFFWVLIGLLAAAIDLIPLNA